MDSSSTIVVLIPLVLVVVILAVVLRLSWRTVPVGEALVITGFGAHTRSDAVGFKIVSTGGVLVLPGVQHAKQLSLAEKRATFTVEVTTSDDARVRFDVVCLFKVGDDTWSIAQAARRFIDQPDEMVPCVEAVFIGHIKAVVGAMTKDDLRDRGNLTQVSRESASIEMEKLGLIVDSLQFHEIAVRP